MFYNGREFRGYSNLGKWYVCWEVQKDEEVNGEFAGPMAHFERMSVGLGRMEDQ